VVLRRDSPPVFEPRADTMKSTLLSAGTLLLVCALSPRLEGVLFASDNIATPSAGQQFFKDKVRPILTEKCYQCHTDSPLSHLRVDSRAALLEGGRNGPAEWSALIATLRAAVRAE